MHIQGRRRWFWQRQNEDLVLRARLRNALRAVRSSRPTIILISMRRLTFSLEEGQRQATLLALAELALSRPGWDHMLREIAQELDGADMFEGFKRTSEDRVKSERAPL